MCAVSAAACHSVLQAVDRNTLMQLRGQTAKGYAFDRRYGPEHTSDNIYDDCMCHLVDNLFKVS
jgi:kinesin family protein 4/21/27